MRAFVFGVLLVACGGSDPAVSEATAGGGSGGAGAALGGAPSAGAAGTVGDVGGSGGVDPVCEPGRSAACACASGSMGAQECKATGQAWGACVCEAAAGGAAGTSSVGVAGAAGAGVSGGGSGGGGGRAGAGGSPNIAGAPAGGTGGAVSGGAGGSVGDPLAPFPAPGCPGFTAYRVPKGSYLAVTSGNFEANNLKNGTCTPLGGDPHYQRCGTFSNVNQCVCTVTSPPTCGQACDGDYYVAVVRAEPGDTLLIRLHEGQGACVAGVPTKIDG